MIKTTFRAFIIPVILILVASCSKQQESSNSPSFLTTMPGNSYSSSLPKPTDDILHTSTNLLETVKTLSADIGERNIEKISNLDKYVNYIKNKFETYGYNAELNSYQYKKDTVSNIYAIKTAKNKTNKIIVIGAHYDTLSGTIGANDNASGVAVLLELARMLQDKALNTNIHFVAFTNEEPPYFKTKSMGSVVYAKMLRQKKSNVIAMYSLETMGVYYNEKGSQKYPTPLVNIIQIWVILSPLSLMLLQEIY